MENYVGLHLQLQVTKSAARNMITIDCVHDMLTIVQPEIDKWRTAVRQGEGEPRQRMFRSLTNST